MVRLVFKVFKSSYKVVWVVLLIVLLLVTLFLPLHPLSVSAASQHLFHPGFGTATIDGVINTSEWLAADSYTALMSNGDNTGTLYVMQNSSTLFLGFVIDDDELTIGYIYGLEGDTAEIFFDDNNSGSLFELMENKTSIFPVAPFFNDSYIYDEIVGSSKADTEDGGQTNGDGKITRQGDYNHIELSFPLCSGDSHDFCLVPGDILGLKIVYDDVYRDQEDQLHINGISFPDLSWDNLFTIEILTIIESYSPIILR